MNGLGVAHDVCPAAVAGRRSAGQHDTTTIEGRMLRPDGLPHFLTPGEVAKLLRTTRKAVYTMIERRQLPGVTRRSGRRILINTARLLEWLDQQVAHGAAR